MRNPPNIGLSFDDIWVKAANGWAPFRFNGNPVANFAALAVGQKDVSLSFIERYDNGDEPPTLSLLGPRDQTVIIYASDDFKTWIPLAHDQLNGLTLTVSDPGFTPGVQRFYRATFANSTLMSISNLNMQQNGTSKMVITGDLAQADREHKNGLLDFIKLMREGASHRICLQEFDRSDVQRHPVVKEVLRLYRDY